jgi:hypothetical protein
LRREKKIDQIGNEKEEARNKPGNKSPTTVWNKLASIPDWSQLPTLIDALVLCTSSSAY